MHLYASSALAITLGLGTATQANAQSAARVSGNQVDEVVITGSLIRGTPEDAALPVDVITNEALQEQGSPSLVDLVRTIPSVSGGNIGESNRFLGGAAAGIATINLRGLGFTRTLSLMNGERLSTITAAGGQEFVNINVVPTIAIGQVEVLRDGAAATYGSDAVAGVVNFILDTRYTGIGGELFVLAKHVVEVVEECGTGLLVEALKVCNHVGTGCCVKK
jgi:iron complex outermembrane receptor protein